MIVSTPRLILASASPRRMQLLREAGFTFSTIPADINEEDVPGDYSPIDVARCLALAKVRALVPVQLDSVILGADTVVAMGEQCLGKPKDAGHASRMLRQLSGTTHIVVTGVAVLCRIKEFEKVIHVTSAVQMRALSEPEIDAYVATHAWMGKAGGYGIQDNDPFVTRMSGSLTNIVGLPVDETIALLREAGVAVDAYNNEQCKPLPASSPF